MWLWIYYDYACYLTLEWERDSKKNRKENNQKNQILKLTFNFHGTLSISNFFWKWAHRIHQEKQKRKKREKKENRGETRRKKRKKEKREKLFVWTPMSEKSILSDLLKTCLLIPLFTN